MKNVAQISRIAYDAQVNVAFHGTHGIGKTAVIETLKAENYYVKTIILSQSDPLVLGGYPGRERLGTDENGKDIFVTTFAKPQWILDLWDAANDGQKVIVFLDEFNRADKYAHNAAMRLVNEKEICGHKVPPSTVFLSAMNFEGPNDGDILPLTDPMMDRWCHVPVYSDSDTWLDWAKAVKVNPLLRSFVAADTDRLNGFEAEGLFEKQIVNRILPTERSNHAVARVLDTITKDGQINKKALSSTPYHLMVQGLCGKEYAVELVTFVENQFSQPFKIEEMLNPSDEVMERLESMITDGMTQIVVASLDAAKAEIPLKVKKPKNLQGFWKFLVKCPVDLQSSFWMGSKDNPLYWRQILAAADDMDLPTEVLAGINK